MAGRLPAGQQPGCKHAQMSVHFRAQRTWVTSTAAAPAATCGRGGEERWGRGAEVARAAGTAASGAAWGLAGRLLACPISCTEACTAAARMARRWLEAGGQQVRSWVGACSHGGGSGSCAAPFDETAHARGAGTQQQGTQAVHFLHPQPRWRRPSNSTIG